MSDVSSPASVHTTVKANVRRTAPNRSAPVAYQLQPGVGLTVTAAVTGEAVQGVSRWYRLGDGNYIWSGACKDDPSAPAAPVVPSAMSGLDPVFAAKLTDLLAACAQKGLIFKISQGVRTPQVQADYYCRWDKHPPKDVDDQVAMLRQQGAPWLAGIVDCYRNVQRQAEWLTNALPGAGWHQWGEAADCYCYRDGKVVNKGSDPCYATYAGLAQQMGLTAGLYFKKHPDPGHVQLRSAGGATDIYSWSYIDGVMRERFSDKPAV